MQTEKAPEGWLDRKVNLDRLVRALWVLCGVLLLVEPLAHKHGEFAFENWFGFHAWVGLLAGVVLVLAARGLRALLRRPGDYYERD